MSASRTNPHWTWIVPLAACLAMGLALAWPGPKRGRIYFPGEPV